MDIEKAPIESGSLYGGTFMMEREDQRDSDHSYYATPEGAGYQQIRREIVEGLKTLMMNEGIEFWVSGYRVGDSNIKALKHISFDSLLSEAGKKEPTPPEGR